MTAVRQPPSTPDHPVLDRRAFGTAVLTVCGGVVLATSVGGCAGPEADPAVDALAALAEAARRDARQLGAADERNGGDADRLRRIGGVRQVHAEALDAEVRRLAPTTTSPSVPADEEPVVCPPTDEVRARLRSDIDSAVQVAATSTGYRAALVASVAASCRAALEVTLS